MDAASQAINSLLSKTSADTSTSDKSVEPVAQEGTSTTVDETVSPPTEATTTTAEVGDQKNMTIDKEVAPAVEHETVKDTHETRKQTEIEKEVHQDHYHTTIQPLKDREVQPEQHDHKAGINETREFEHDDAAGTKAKVEAQQNFKNTTEQAATKEKKVDEGTVDAGTHVHHHLHETIQPVIEKETVRPSVTHVTDHVKEKHHEKSKVHGTTTNEAISVDDFKGSLAGETKPRERADGAPEIA